MTKIIIPLVLGLLLLGGCKQDEPLRSSSVVEQGQSKITTTELDTWIREHITDPYGIEVVYRWERNTSPQGVYLYPPTIAKVKPVLEAIIRLWIEVYTDSKIGGERYMQGDAPLRIYLYGGRSVDTYGVELLGNPKATPSEMYLFDVDDFDPRDADKVFVLMRSVHHQFAQSLMARYHYDRDAFATIGAGSYVDSTKEIAATLSGIKKRRDIFSLQPFVHRRGFYTLHSMLSPVDDFAEMISATLTHSPAEVAKIVDQAVPAYIDPDPDVRQRDLERSRRAQEQLRDKQAFVERYFSQSLGINLKRLQLVSLQKLRAYTQP